MKARAIKIMAGLLLTGAMLAAGCGSLSDLPKYMWQGFGYSLGGIPGNIIGTTIATALGIETAAGG
jgi:hypothetical protein